MDVILLVFKLMEVWYHFSHVTYECQKMNSHHVLVGINVKVVLCR